MNKTKTVLYNTLKRELKTIDRSPTYARRECLKVLFCHDFTLSARMTRFRKGSMNFNFKAFRVITSEAVILNLSAKSDKLTKPLVCSLEKKVVQISCVNTQAAQWLYFNCKENITYHFLFLLPLQASFCICTGCMFLAWPARKLIFENAFHIARGYNELVATYGPYAPYPFNK